jgi:hypothetical protein
MHPIARAPLKTKHWTAFRIYLREENINFHYFGVDWPKPPQQDLLVTLHGGDMSFLH